MANNKKHYVPNAPKKVHHPHKEQNAWVYIRVQRLFGKRHTFLKPGKLDEVAWPPVLEYNDNQRGSRIITSRRVEQGVELLDFVQKCADEGLTITITSKGRYVVNSYTGSTLREAYYRHKNGMNKTFYQAVVDGGVAAQHEAVPASGR